ncbi:MAG: hypothetical protein Ta2E_03550 [Mycoplasmoidaceae bacterium]|nr:MAG: hypothetical protein Ta2E_03550 [Mycoplasmoidaceae bacterium]
MKIKKLLFLCAPLISIASVATIVTTSCNKASGISTGSAIEKITPEYFGGDEGSIDASQDGLLMCYKFDAKPNEIESVMYAFDSIHVEQFLDSDTFDLSNCNVESMIEIIIKNTEKDQKKMSELQAITVDPNSTPEQRNNAVIEMIELKYKNTTVYVKGTYSFKSYADIVVNNPNVTKKAYNTITAAYKKADKNYDVLAKKLLDMWNAAQPSS